jgi:hypothetical protein
MMKIGKSAMTAMALSVLMVGLSGCQKQEGPAQRAGKEIDKAVEKAGQQIEKAGENIQDAAKGAKK